MLTKIQIKHNVLNYWKKQEQILQGKVNSLDKAIQYEKNSKKLVKLITWGKNNINKLLKARAEIRKLVDEGVR